MIAEIEQPQQLNSFEAILSLEKMNFKTKIELAKEGITKDTLSDLKEIFELRWVNICHMLNISSRTLHVTQGNEKFNQMVSDRIITIIGVYGFGYMIFEDQKKFNNWMKRKNGYLLDLSPVEIMEWMPGIEEVKMEIRRIAFGVS